MRFYIRFLRTDQPRGGLGHVSPAVRINKTIVRAQSYSSDLLICSRYLCHANTQIENSLFICMSTFPRSKPRRAIDWGQSKLKKGGDDRSVTRLYTEIPLFTHFTTIALSPFEAKPRERSRAFPNVSELFRAFRNFLTIPFTIAARAVHTSPIDITFRHNSFSNIKSTLPNISERSLLITPESHSGISFFLSNSFLLVSRRAPLLVK